MFFPGASAPAAWAICAVIPWFNTFFDSDLGRVSRPFAAPGETLAIAIAAEQANQDFVVTFVTMEPELS